MKYLTLFTLLVLLPATNAQTPRGTPCFGIGDTITVTGTYSPTIGSNFHLYQPRAKSLCVHYPKRTSRAPLTDLDVNVTDGPLKNIKLPQKTYVEVTGVLTDLYPELVIGFKVTSFRNVDAEIKTEIADWTQRCKEWQDEQLTIISKKLHGGVLVQ